MSPGRRRSGWHAAARFTGAGAAMTGAVVGGLLLGMALDRWLGTAPWLALAGLVLGAVGGFLELFRALRAWQRQEDMVSTSGRSNGPSSPSEPS